MPGVPATVGKAAAGNDRGGVSANMARHNFFCEFLERSFRPTEEAPTDIF